jgi:hypothetical protein
MLRKRISIDQPSRIGRFGGSVAGSFVRMVVVVLGAAFGALLLLFSAMFALVVLSIVAVGVGGYMLQRKLRGLPLPTLSQWFERDPASPFGSGASTTPRWSTGNTRSGVVIEGEVLRRD